MTESIRLLFEWWKVPRIYVTAVAVGVFGGGLVSIYTRTIDLIAAPFVWAGCIILLHRVWSKNLTWTQFLRLTAFWVALGLMITGNLIFYARAK